MSILWLIFWYFVIGGVVSCLYVKIEGRRYEDEIACCIFFGWPVYIVIVIGSLATRILTKIFDFIAGD